MGPALGDTGRSKGRGKWTIHPTAMIAANQAVVETPRGHSALGSNRPALRSVPPAIRDLGWTCDVIQKRSQPGPRPMSETVNGRMRSGDEKNRNSNKGRVRDEMSGTERSFGAEFDRCRKRSPSQTHAIVAFGTVECPWRSLSCGPGRLVDFRSGRRCWLWGRRAPSAVLAVASSPPFCA